MTMNPIPPQAYTKDTLLKAYSWLQNQPQNIKEMASTPDILVSLYLKTTRDGEGALTRPSIQNFKNELKQLAGMMGDFESASGQQPSNPSAAQPTQSAIAQTANPQPVNSSYIPNAHPPVISDSILLSSQQPKLTPHQVQLDAKSWFMIQEVKEKLNLSSEMDALKAIIKIGSERFKNL